LGLAAAAAMAPNHTPIRKNKKAKSPEMAKKAKTFTTNFGSPVSDDQNSLTCTGYLGHPLGFMT